MSDNDTNTVGGRVAKGAAMLTGARFFGRLVGFLNTLILARLLVPDDFGLVALGLTVLQLLQNLSDFGVAQAVIKFRDSDRDQVDTLFTLSFLRGVIVGGFLLAISGAAGHFYDDPRVGQIFIAVAFIAFGSALINPRFYEFERDLQFAREAIVTIIIKILSVVASVSIALIYQSFWAIVAGYAAGILVQVILSYVLKPYRPRFSFGSVKKLIGFTGWLTGVSALVALNNKTEVLILGRILGTTPTGLYYVGEQVAAMSTMEISTPIARAVYPGLSTQQDDPAQMRRTYLQGTEALAAVATPAAIGCAFVAEDFISVVLGGRWPEAAPVLQVFAPVFGFVSIYMATQAFAMAAGLTRQVFFRELIFFLVKTPIFIAGAVFGGLSGALAAAAFNGGFYILLQARLYGQVSGAHPLEPLWAARRSILALAGMALWFWCIRPFVPGYGDLPTILRLAIDVMLGGAGYIGCHVLAWRSMGAPEGIETAILSLIRARLKSSANRGAVQ